MMLTLTNLRCEYAENPLGIDAAHPRLSWVLIGEGRNQRQSAYQILAASSPEGLQAGASADLWDSGTVSSAASLVEYGGRPLGSSQRCWWKVRVWDQDGQPSPDSPPAWFEMGLLSPDDWQADWLGWPGGSSAKARYFRRDFSLDKPVRRARVYMAGLGWSELYINGQRVNDRVLDPPQSDTSKRVLYTTDAVEDFLQAGKNSIGVICGSGWSGSPRLLLQLQLEFADGSSQKIITSQPEKGSWLVGSGPILENSVFDGEVYDARLENPLWASPDGPTAGMQNPHCTDGPPGKRVAAALEPIRVVETWQAKTISQPKAGVFVIDLGQNMAGWARLRVKGAAGQRVSIKYAESLYADGTLNQENLRSAKTEDVYILKGVGEECWEPRFTYHGFRYIQVEGYPGVPTADDIQGRRVRSAVASSGTFECSSTLYNRIHKMVQQTEASNLHSLPTDCPQRDERMGWLNDMAARTEEALHNFNLARLLAKWLADIQDEQDPRSGAICDTAPYHWGRRPADPVSVCYLMIPWMLYVHYGDTHTLAARYNGMKAWVDYLTTRTQDQIVEYSYYGDWVPPIAFGDAVSKYTPGKLVSTACYAYCAHLLSQIAAVLGNARDAAAYQHLFEQIAERYNAHFWNEELGGYASGNQACNAISLYMGLVPPAQRERVAASLVRSAAEADYHLTTGNICTKYLFEALSESGHIAVASQIAAQESYPGWGFMLANGATTLWERWELTTGGGMNSHNHPMLGSVGAWFYRWVAGIQADPRGPGFARFDIRPDLNGELTWARATLQTLRGLVEVSWRKQAGRIELDLTVPVGSQARVFFPAPKGAVLKEGQTVLWQAGQPGETLIPGQPATREGDQLCCVCGSGAYHFFIDDVKPPQ